MEKSNTTRVLDDKQSKSGDADFEAYLKSGLPSMQVESLLRSQNKDEKEIRAFMDKFEVSKKKINKLIKKFVEKIEQRYGHLDTPELMKKGLKFASKHNFTHAEKEAFIRFVLKGDTDAQYMPFQELGYTEMAKFLGFAAQPGQSISVKPTDHNALNEIARLYDASKPIHSAIRNNVVMYTECSPDAVSGLYDHQRHNINMFIHPLIVALFLSKIDVLEKRMLHSNIGRLVVHRTQAYFQTQQAGTKKFMNWNINTSDLLPTELKADFELAFDIARDPNSLNYFSDESPMSNLLKRYNVQIELWKNVLSLRQGKFYSKSDNFNEDDGITGLVKVLSQYDWTYFDSPDLYQVHDEGTLLRKLLAVFSFRPTFTQIASLVHNTSVGYSNMGVMSKATFINTPICNVKIPSQMYGTVTTTNSVSLADALSQSDWFIENKMLVPKSKTVIHSRDIIFFYVNRRHQSVNFANVDMRFNYLSLPGTLSGITSINTTRLEFTETIQVGQDNFCLRSVVALNPLLDGQLSTGCSSVIIRKADHTIGMQQPVYYHYNPVAAGISIRMQNNLYQRPAPISALQHTSVDNYQGYDELIHQYGTVFVFVNPVQQVPC
jgi:hypothetical protein